MSFGFGLGPGDINVDPGPFLKLTALERATARRVVVGNVTQTYLLASLAVLAGSLDTAVQFCHKMSIIQNI